jgi:leucyl/phenylalanyl-tRNA---protein transferase
MPRLTPELLLCAYASGLFPMANDRHDPTIHWIEPRRRGILPLERFHMPRSLRKIVRQERFSIRTDRAFEKVIRACAEPRPNRPRTWLNDELIALYIGLYGVSIGGAFFGESMFSLERDASKVALAVLVERLRAGGYCLLDTQFVTDHLRQFGVIEVPQRHYKQELRAAIMRRATFYSDGGDVVSAPPWAPAGALPTGSSQSTTQRS